MTQCRLALRCGVVLCLCLTQLAQTQGRTPSGDMATEAGASIPTQLTQNGVSSTLEVRITATFRRGKFIATALRKDTAAEQSEDALPLSPSSTKDAVNPMVNSASAPAPTTSPSPDSAIPAPPMIVPTTKAAPAAAAPAAAPAQENMCTYNEVCEWNYDLERGVAHRVCNTKPPDPRGWGNLCPRDAAVLKSICIMVPFGLVYTFSPCVLKGVALIWRRGVQWANNKG